MDLSYKNFKEVIISVIVGFFIGLSVIVPGISGSTIAIIMKVYDKFMYATSNIFKKFKASITFLIPIVIGIVLGFALGFLLVKTLLDLFPFVTICLFVGLMVGTFPILFKEIKGKKNETNKIPLFILGVILPIFISVISIFLATDKDITSVNILHYLLFIAIGILVSLTQLIPGLSATVLLMIFGYYKFLIDGVTIDLLNNVNLILIYLSLAMGFLIGTLMFSKIITKLLETKRTQFFFIICGLSIGSMVSVFLGNECIEIYKTWDNSEMVKDLIFGFIAIILGFALTFAIYLYDKNKNNNKAQSTTM